MREETDGNIYVVGTWLKENCRAWCAELVALLDGVDVVDLSLNTGGIHGVIEDHNIAAKIGCVAAYR